MKELTLEPNTSQTVFSTFSHQLEWAKKRNDCLEQYRIQNVLKNSDHNFKQVFSFVSLFIHINHPALPAYVENAPAGICHFQPDEFQQAYLNKLSIVQMHMEPTFDGLYVMGSIGSITQTCFSDLDLWLCHSCHFSLSEQRLIQKKLALIKQWAKELGVDVNFYLMNPQAFREKNYYCDICDDHNGSAQHFFLLDEFYRSAIRLAGKRILWLHLKNEAGEYDNLIAQAIENNELDINEWIDFGDFSSLSVDEFVGAALWQMYKGIRSPYKSAIKILLLESYTQTYPHIELISKKFKQLLLSPCGINYHFDPYQAMLEQASIYLKQKNALERLHFLRHCFYIKACDGQTDPDRLHTLNLLAKDWQWHPKEIELLNKRRQWQIKQVAQHHKLIVAQLLQSYQTLLQFARNLQIDPSILPQDIDFLMRQLYSAFEAVPGKIELVNEKGHYSLEEKNITFTHVLSGGVVKSGWYLLNHAPFTAYEPNKRYVHYEPNLTMAIAWAYFNGLLTENSQIHLISKENGLHKLHQFAHDLRHSFPAKSPRLSREDFNHPNEIRNLIVAINLTRDPTEQFDQLSNAEIDQLDLFNLSPSKQGIIGSVSIIYRNMWNEIITRHFEKDDALLKALKLISNKLYLSSAPPQSVQVFSYSKNMSHELQEFVLSLVNRCITVKTGSVFQRYQPQIVQMAGRKWQLVFDKQQELKEVVEGRETLEVLPTIPPEVFSFASEGFLQFFFDDNTDQSFNVYVLDKHNKVECYFHCYGEKEDKIRAISRLYAESIRVKELQDIGSFNFPQFYQLLRQQNLIHIVPFQSKQHRDFLDATD